MVENSIEYKYAANILPLPCDQRYGIEDMKYIVNQLLQYIYLYSNGHLALESAIEALGLTGEVITTPFTFASTTHAIVRKGLKPVFCDINIDDYTIDASKIESLITEKTSAIIPVHVYGNVCNIKLKVGLLHIKIINCLKLCTISKTLESMALKRLSI